MSRVLQWIGRAVVGGVFVAMVNGVWLVIAWQAIVIGLIAGPGGLAAVAAAGLASGLALLAAHELGHAFAGWAAGLPPVSLTLVFLRID